MTNTGGIEFIGFKMKHTIFENAYLIAKKLNMKCVSYDFLGGDWNINSI